jgi:hypothetical protein
MTQALRQAEQSAITGPSHSLHLISRQRAGYEIFGTCATCAVTPLTRPGFEPDGAEDAAD